MYVCTPLPGDSKHVERKPFGSILTQSSRDRCTRASQPSTKNLHTRRLLLLLCQCSFTLLILLAVYSNTYKKHYSYGEKRISLVLLKKSFNLTTLAILYLSLHFFVLTNYHVWFHSYFANTSNGYTNYLPNQRINDLQIFYINSKNFV